MIALISMIALCNHPQPAVIDHPSVVPKHCRPQPFGNLSARFRRLEHRTGEHREPVFETVLALDARWAIEQTGEGDLEAVPFEHWRVFADAREIPRRLDWTRDFADRVQHCMR